MLTFLVGLVPLTNAVLDATRFADQTARHGDELATVISATVAGLVLGVALALLVQRLVMGDDAVATVPAHSG